MIRTFGPPSGAPRAERGPGARLNMTEFWFREVQIDGENGARWSENWFGLQKKGLRRNFNDFSGRNQVISKKKRKRSSSNLRRFSAKN